MTTNEQATDIALACILLDLPVPEDFNNLTSIQSGALEIFQSLTEAGYDIQIWGGTRIILPHVNTWAFLRKRLNVAHGYTRHYYTFQGGERYIPGTFQNWSVKEWAQSKFTGQYAPVAYTVSVDGFDRAYTYAILPKSVSPDEMKWQYPKDDGETLSNKFVVMPLSANSTFVAITCIASNRLLASEYTAVGIFSMAAPEDEDGYDEHSPSPYRWQDLLRPEHALVCGCETDWTFSQQEADYFGREGGFSSFIGRCGISINNKLVCPDCGKLVEAKLI